MASGSDIPPDRKEVTRLGELVQKTSADLKKAITDKNYKTAVNCVNTLQRSLDNLRPPMRRLIGSSVRFTWEPSRIRGRARGVWIWFFAGAVISGIAVYYVMRG